MKVYIYYDESKPEIDLIYNVLHKDITLKKVEIEAESSSDAIKIFEQMLANNEL